MDAVAFDRSLERAARKLNDLPHDLLAENRDYLRPFITPYVGGPFDKPTNEPGVVWHFLDFGDGPKAYRQTIETLPYNAQVAIAGMHEARLAAIHLDDDGDIRWLFKAALVMGKATGILSGSDAAENAQIGSKVIAGVERAAVKNRKLKGKRYPAAVLRRVNTLIKRGMKPVTACKHCAVEFGNRGKLFSWRTAYRAWEKQDPK